MGEISDMILDGILDQYTGEYIGPGVGYPRSQQGQQQLKPKQIITLYVTSHWPKNHPWKKIKVVCEEFAAFKEWENTYPTLYFSIVKHMKQFKTWFKNTYNGGTQTGTNLGGDVHES